MTKEEILAKNRTSTFNAPWIHTKEEALLSMDEYAKQVAIEFSKFRDYYRHIENMNWKHNVTDKIGMVTWVGASDDKIYEAYKEGKQLLRWIEDPNNPDNMLQK